MYRQLYMGGGIGSLDAGAPSIKYEGDIRPQMTSAPDPMDALNDLAMQLFGKPLDRLTPSERQALDEYNSGMMAVGGRVNYGIGSSIKKAVKKVGNVVKKLLIQLHKFSCYTKSIINHMHKVTQELDHQVLVEITEGLQVGGYYSRSLWMVNMELIHFKEDNQLLPGAYDRIVGMYRSSGL
jgi:hypothetical protein